MAKVDRSSSRHCFCLLLLLFKQTHIHAISLPMLYCMYNPCLTKEEKSKQNVRLYQEPNSMDAVMCLSEPDTLACRPSHPGLIDVQCSTDPFCRS
ncbi:hypothetical protein LB506_000742 [Fusarium annulatum]|nr:hypothetical protein LB506_000742 [Fusarium annulatum]